MIRKLCDPDRAGALFGNWEETLIWTALQNLMGSIYAPDGEPLRSAAAVSGDFCFFAGEPNRELIRDVSGLCRCPIAVPQNDDWARAIEKVYGSRASLRMRYAIRKEPEVFDREALVGAAESLPAGFTLLPIDEAIYYQCRTARWSEDFVSQYPSYEAYARLGVGLVVTEGDAIVSGASSYISYRDGIEIQVATREDRRRMGLAYACAAALILACLDRGLYPSWDAHNVGSVALAEKLGYHFSHTYPVYEITY